METQCFQKSLNFKDTRQEISVPLAMSTNLRKKSFKLFKNPEKNNSWADLGPRSAGKKLSQMFGPATRFRVWTAIDGQNQRLRCET